MIVRTAGGALVREHVGAIPGHEAGENVYERRWGDKSDDAMRWSFAHRLGRAFRRLIIGRLPPPPNDAQIATVYRNLFRQCPVCGRTLEGHAVWRLASVIVGEAPKREDALADLVARGQWTDAARITESEHDKDAREYDVIRCPFSDRLGLVTAVFTAEFWSNSFVEDARALASEDGEEIAKIAADRWRTL
jgi:hypothetical protein